MIYAILISEKLMHVADICGVSKTNFILRIVKFKLVYIVNDIKNTVKRGEEREGKCESVISL